MNDELAVDFRLARSGDRAALSRLLQRNQERLNQLAHRRLGKGLRTNIHTSDLLQSTYLEVLASIREFEGTTDESFVAWFGRIIDNNARDKVRFFEAQKRGADRTHVPVSEGNSVSKGPSPSLLAAFTEEMLRLEDAMSKIPAEYREVIEWKGVQGLGHAEIAARLGRSETAVRSLLARARTELLLVLDRLRRERENKHES